MKKILFFILIMLLLWYAPTLRAVPQGGGRAPYGNADSQGDGPDSISDIENQIRVILDKVSPSLVKVIAENGRKYVASGIALEDGLVITSAQVTKYPFAKLTVETTKGELIAARVAGQDDRSGLTLLRLEKKKLPTLPLAGPAEVGNWVALIGLFYEKFPAISQGIVSSRGENELILNAAVAPGAAGGAVVNKNGELLGVIRGSVGFSFTPDLTFKDNSVSIVVSGRRSKSGGLCYAIPIAPVRRMAEKIKTDGKIIPGWLGVALIEDTNQVQETYPGSPAAKAGIAGGDRIIKLAGKQVANWHDIVSALAFRFAGDKVDITLRRANRTLRLDVKLADRSRGVAPEPPRHIIVPEIPGFPDLAEQLDELPDLSDLDSSLPKVRDYVIEFSGARQLGIDVIDITADLGEKFAVKEGYGLLVSRVTSGSAASQGGLKAGDIIVRANDRPLHSSRDLRRTLNALQDKEAVLLAIYRDGQLRKFSLVPDKNNKLAWDARRFMQKMENLKGHISDEAKAMLQEEILNLKLAKEKAFDGLQKEKQLSLKKAREQSRDLALELKRLQTEKNKLSEAARKKFSAELRMIQEELRKIEEQIRCEEERDKGNDRD